jgi:hypothetical protein
MYETYRCMKQVNEVMVTQLKATFFNTTSDIMNTNLDTNISSHATVFHIQL